MKNAIGWVEIPVLDMERAMHFYETVFGYTLSRHTMGPLDMAWFPNDQDGTGSPASLVKHDWYKPSKDGVLIYFTAPSGDLQNELATVMNAGGTIVIQKKLVSESYGYIAVITDTEGNRVALHSTK